jgi:TolB-like protein/lipoprotein NlpI
MASLITNYEYDIFSSYRHNDNRSGWVTEFVNALQEELAATIKEPLSIYFDKNPDDGLLETHHVDKSLEGKLKCLIFIPVISQTYCDTKSFAWQHEFCAFNKIAQADPLGRDIKVGNGNVASRILPIKIHDIDTEDKVLLESELGGVLRAIEFIYKEAGVNRPLRSNEENPTKNQNQTIYRNQVNKVANGVKEIIYSLKNPVTQTPLRTNNEVSNNKRGRNKKLTIAIVAALVIISATIYFLYPNPNSPPQLVEMDKSIAVLAFDDLSDDQSQEYFSDGISEEILNTLSQMPGLKVSGRTSSFSFKNKDVSIQEIGHTLGVATVLEGSIRKIGNKIRITAQLINVEDGFHIFSERFDRDMNDIFAIQDEIADLIAQKLKVTLLNKSSVSVISNTTENVTAYEQYLQGKFYSSQGSQGVRKSKVYFDKAIELAPEFGLAHYGLGRYYWMMSISNFLSVHTAMPIVLNEANLALNLDPGLAEAYDLKGWYYANYEYDYATAINYFEKAIEINPGYADGHENLARYYRNIGDIQKGLPFARKAVELDPLTLNHRLFLAELLQNAGNFDSALSVLNDAMKIDPDKSYTYLALGYYYMRLEMFDKAVEYLDKANQHANERVKYIIIAALWLQGNKDRSLKLLDELLSSQDEIISINVAEIYAYMGKDELAIEWLTKSFTAREYVFPSIKARIGFNRLHNDPRYQALEAKVKFP